MSNRFLEVRGVTDGLSDWSLPRNKLTIPFNRGDGPGETWRTDFKARRDENWFVSREACERHALGDSYREGEFE
jgi:hypothetical protein